jgi:hypothetical protein
MNTRVAIPVIWTLSGAVLIKLWSAWPRLPGRVATHFGASLQPNGWSSKGALAAIILIAVLGQAVLATFVLLRVAGAAGPAGVMLLLVNMVLVSAMWQTINYNAEGSRFEPVWMFGPIIVLLTAITLVLARGLFHYYRR